MIPLILSLLLDGSRFVCGNDGSLAGRLEAIDARRPELSRRIAASTPPVASGGVVILNADDESTPFDRPFDLGSVTLRFARSGSSSWSVTRDPHGIDPDYGTAVDVDPDGQRYAAVALPFEFPFYDTTIPEIFVTPFNSIHLAPPPMLYSPQLSDLDLATGSDAVIAPMLTTDWLQAYQYPDVFVKTDADSVRVTWRREAGWWYVIQATLTAAGDVTFAYDVEVAPHASALVIRPGAVSGEARTLGQASDPAGDAPEAMLDIVSASMSRIDGTNLVRFRFETAAEVNTAGLGPSEWIAWSASVTTPPLMFRLYGDGHTRYTVPGWGSVANSSAARVQGNVIELDVLDEQLAIAPGARTIEAATWRGGDSVDVATLVADIDEATRQLASDTSALDDGSVLSGPVLEAFTLPVLNVNAVWRQLQHAWDLDPAAVDAVAIFPAFRTDLVLYAGAYSTGGNPGADNIHDSKTFVASDLPRSPALMHMGRLGSNFNRDPRLAAYNLMHEIGHRWLYDVAIVENGTRTRVLNPSGGHPAQYVDTRAAFPVTSTEDSSVMGGGTFTDTGGGTFASWSTRLSNGYSWTDLYLMGLASPSEVEPWFYLANSDPALGPSYYPPSNRSYRADRRDVTIDQLIDAMGARHPQYPETQRDFRVVFVLLTRGGFSSDEIDQLASMRQMFEQRFRQATGNRGSVQTNFTGPAPPRRRAAGR